MIYFARVFCKKTLAKPAREADIKAVETLSDTPWRSEDLGRPIPDDDHACSVALPTWESVVGYEEGDSAVLEKLQAGYPRFCLHPKVRALFDSATAELAREGETAVVFPRATVVQRAQRFIEQRAKVATSVKSYRGLQALILPKTHEKYALEYWRYTGEAVTSRQAQAALELGDPGNERGPEMAVRAAYAADRSVSIEDVFLFESGMAAVFATHRAVLAQRPGKKTLQIEFPYVDVMRVQQNFGQGVAYLNLSEGENHTECLKRIRDGEFSGVFCEMPSNPLLRCVNLPELSEVCRASDTLLIVDDTVASHHNVDVMPYADVITTSMTKWISGKGNVMAGSVVINEKSQHAADLRSFLSEATDSGRLFADDAAVLLENMRGFRQRMSSINANGLALYQYLSESPAVSEVWYPKSMTPYRYEDVKTLGGGYGGLISFTLQSARRAEEFYDRLQLSKGPSLGTEFTLVCPYTLLAHYDELGWAKDCGVPAALIRVSVGIEPIEDLLGKFAQAFAAL